MLNSVASLVAMIAAVMLISCAGATVTSYAASNLATWGKTVSGISNYNPAGVTVFGNTAVLVTGGEVFGFNASTGAVVYGPVLQGGMYSDSSLVHSTCDGEEYLILTDFGLLSQDVVAMNPHTGEKKWSINAPFASAVTADGCTLVFAKGSPDTFVRVRVSTGNIMTTAPALGYGSGQTNTIADGMMIGSSLANNVHNVSAIDVNTFLPTWTSAISGDFDNVVTPPLASGSTTVGDVYVTGSTVNGGNPDTIFNYVAAVEATTGKTTWSHYFNLLRFSPAVFVGQSDFCTSAFKPRGSNAMILCFNRATGTYSSAESSVGSASGMVSSTKLKRVFVAEQSESTTSNLAYQLSWAQPSAPSLTPIVTIKLEEVGTYIHQQNNIAIVEGQRLVLFGLNDGRGSYTLKAYPMPE